MAAASTVFKVATLGLFEQEALYVGLCTIDPGDNNNPLAEVQLANWPSYARQQVPSSNAWTAPAVINTGEQEIENLVQYNYPQQDGTNNVTLTYIAFYTAATGGNLVARAAMAQAKTIQPGDGVAISPAGIRIRAG